MTDRRQAVAPLPEVVAAAVAGGARWVLLREKDLPYGERVALAATLREVLAPEGRLIVAGPDPLDGDAVHLAAADPTPVTAESIMEFSEGHAGDTPKRVHDQLEGRSCHGAADLARLTTEDYVTLSPVFASRSKPGYGPVLGPDRLAELCALAGRPVLALGGIETPAQVADCRAAGAAGVAVMGAVMRAEDPAAVVADLAGVLV